MYISNGRYFNKIKQITFSIYAKNLNPIPLRSQQLINQKKDILL